MKIFPSHLQTVQQLITGYRGEIPLSSHLKKYFSAHKKHGSRDRKIITGMCYHYFRLGSMMKRYSFEQQLGTAEFLCNKKEAGVLELLMPECIPYLHLSVLEKINLLAQHYSLEDIFPFNQELSAGVDTIAHARSFLDQPDLFIRVRPGFSEQVATTLTAAGISYQQDDNCIALPNQTKLEPLFTPDKKIVIQDFHSQKVMNSLIQHEEEYFPKKTVINVWDCCAASGGKSILLLDILKRKIDLTVSDIRESILHNLKLRFKQAGLTLQHSFCADLSHSDYQHPYPTQYDLVICDAPCSGSGTWSRTPEQISFFKPEQISTFQEMQKNIASHAFEQLAPGGIFVYITCSVFRKENEDVVEFLKGQGKCTLLSQQLFAGYQHRCDSMFVAILKK